MPNPPAFVGLLNLADSAAGGIALSTLVKRVNEGKTGEKGAIKLSTLKSHTHAKDIHSVLEDLVCKGLIRIDGNGMSLYDAETLIIRGLRVDVELAGAMSEDESGQHELGFAPGDLTFARPSRIVSGQDVVTRGEHKYWGFADYTHASAESDEIVKANLRIWAGTVGDNDDVVDNTAPVYDRDFLTPEEAWAAFDEYVGPDRAPLFKWIADTMGTEKHLLLDPDTFEHVCVAFREEKEGNVDRKIACNQGLARGVLEIATELGRISFERLDDGHRWPGLPAPVPAAIGDPEADAEEVFTDPEARNNFLPILDGPVKVGGPVVHVKIVPINGKQAKVDLTTEAGYIGEAGTKTITAPRADIEPDPLAYAEELTKELAERYAKETTKKR